MGKSRLDMAVVLLSAWASEMVVGVFVGSVEWPSRWYPAELRDGRDGWPEGLLSCLLGLLEGERVRDAVAVASEVVEREGELVAEGNE